MGKCKTINCDAELSKKNVSGLCMKCYNNRNGKHDSNISEDGMNDYCEEEIVSVGKNLNDIDGDFWSKMDSLLDKKLSVQEEKIKQAVIAEVSGKVDELTKHHKKLEEENKSFRQRITAIETRQKNIEQESKKMKNIITMQQGYIIQQDKLLRQKRLLISGLSEKKILKHGEESAEDDSQKLEIIFNALDTSTDNLISFKRIGSPDQGPGNRPFSA